VLDVLLGMFAPPTNHRRQQHKVFGHGLAVIHQTSPSSHLPRSMGVALRSAGSPPAGAPLARRRSDGVPFGDAS
jgi:hypothetical protein